MKCIYNVWFHPLRNFPGPTLAAATPLPFVWRLLNGRLVPWNIKLHAKYGEIVRTSPDELSFIGASAWKDIYMARPGLPKPTFGMLETPSGVWTMATAPDPENHQRQRKIVSHAFSDRALREQEYIIQRYSDLLISRLRDQDGEIDLCRWFHFMSFDMMGELNFGESFNCLRNAENHEWVGKISSGFYPYWIAH